MLVADRGVVGVRSGVCVFPPSPWLICCLSAGGRVCIVSRSQLFRWAESQERRVVL